MRFLVMGAGALGGFFGARLQAAGHDVSYVARGAHLEAMQARGLRLESPKGDLHLEHVHAVASAAEAGMADAVLFMVKSYDLEDAARALAPSLAPDTTVVTCQNGISAPERLAALIGASRVVTGVARVPAEIAAPGIIRHTAELDIFSLGEADGRITPRVEAIRDALAESGTTARIPGNITHDLWQKFVSQSALASMTTLLQCDFGAIRDTEETRQLFFDAMEETERVGRALMPDLPGGIGARAWEALKQLPDTFHASMLDDLRNGKPLENDYMSGDVVRLGVQAGVPTPIHRVFHAALKPFTPGRRSA